MKTIIMNQDIHQPAFIKADASYKTEKNRQPPSSPKQVRRFGWTRFIELAVLLSIVIGAVYLYHFSGKWRHVAPVGSH